MADAAPANTTPQPYQPHREVHMTQPETATAETPERIRYTADVVVLTPDDDVLLIQRDWPPYEGDWALPGGYAKGL
jgi:8-oxo-dGTP pyrophosphatase MutT (NUDIX family)